jgi:predicted nucleotide-binding protein (sugar kinase/HSP70/actin superfamily)
MIAELAHLENRVNTHLNQMKKNLHEKLSHNGNVKFSIELFNDFNMNGYNKDEFVMYVPTMGDNRTLSAVFRASGFSVVDNFDDETFDLAEKVKIGKKYIGDSACVPLTAIYSDMLMAVNDFQKRKEEGDPIVNGRDKILLFMQYSDGPCRQGQYIDICKLNLYNQFRNSDNSNRNTKNLGRQIKFLPNLTTALHRDQDYLTQLEKWAALQVFQIVVIKDVLHSIFLKHSAQCKNNEEFQKFKIEYGKLKKEIYDTIEYNMKPGRLTQNIVDQIESKISWFSGIAKYIGYGFYNNNGLRKIFREFDRKWNRNSENERITVDDKIKIHVEGEVYLRIAQLEEIQKILIDTLGYNSFRLNYSPMWAYFEYMLEQRIVLAEDEIQMYRGKMNDIGINGEVSVLLKKIRNEKNKIKEASNTSGTLRNILARPLYKAAGLKMTHEIKEDLKEARLVLPTLKPEGELIPYIGAAISEIDEGTDLILNIAPEGCMVASMGEMLTPKILQMTNNKKARIQYLSTTEGEINDDLLSLALLKILGPENYYSQSTI